MKKNWFNKVTVYTLLILNFIVMPLMLIKDVQTAIISIGFLILLGTWLSWLNYQRKKEKAAYTHVYDARSKNHSYTHSSHMRCCSGINFSQKHSDTQK